jgi:hypothetical protein
MSLDSDAERVGTDREVIVAVVEAVRPPALVALATFVDAAA